MLPDSLTQSSSLCHWAFHTLLQRSGSRQELLRGPFMYGAVISALTALYWRDSPVGVTAIAVLCAGDGFADIIGRRYGGSNKLPHSPDKVRY